MRILYLHQYFATRQGATGTRSYEFARYLVQQGHRVTVICGTVDGATLRLGRRSMWASTGEVDGVQVIRINARYSSQMSFQRRVASFLLFMIGAFWQVMVLQRPDVILATSTPLTVAVPALCGWYLRKIPFVFEVRDLWPEVPIEMGILRNRLLQSATIRLAALAYRRATSIVALSPGIAKGIEAYGIDARKIVLIPNASDVDLFSPQVASSTLKAELGIRDNQLVVGYFGAMGLANGLGTLVDAAESLQQTCQDQYVFVLVGAGPVRATLMDAARRRGLRNVLFLDKVPRAQMPKFVALADVCLVLFAGYSSLEANSPNKLFDALAAGKPVLVNKAGWMQALVEEYGVGVALPDCTGREMALALQELAADPGRRETMGQKARALAEEQFERRRLAERLSRVLSTVRANHEAPT